MAVCHKMSIVVSCYLDILPISFDLLVDKMFVIVIDLESLYLVAW